MLTKIKIALFVALVFGAASVAQARSNHHSANGNEAYAYDRQVADYRLSPERGPWQVLPPSQDPTSAPGWSPFIGPR